MNIIVCFKVVSNLDQMKPGDFVIKENTKIDTSFVKTELNCFDESGLEFGLRLSSDLESLNLYKNITAITIGDSKSDTYLKNLYALKYDKAIRVDNSTYDLRFSPEIIGNIISNYIEQEPQDIIIMGNQSPEGNNYSTPQIVGHNLNIPVITDVIDMNIECDGVVTINKIRNNQLIEEKVKTPAIFTIGNAIISKLRIPTLKDRMKFGKKDIIRYNIDDLTSLNEDSYKTLISLKYIERQRKGIIIEDKNAIDSLYEEYLKERLQDI